MPPRAVHTLKGEDCISSLFMIKRVDIVVTSQTKERFKTMHICILKRTMYQRKVDVDMLNAVKTVG